MDIVKATSIAEMLLEEIIGSANPHLSKETVVLRIFRRLAAEVFNASWSSMVETLKNGPYVMSPELHGIVKNLWESGRTKLLDEQACVERILSKDYLRQGEMVKLAGVLAKAFPRDVSVWKLFAVDGFRGDDVKHYVNSFKAECEWRDRHVRAVRELYDDGVESPEKMKLVLETILFTEERGEHSRRRTIYEEILGPRCLVKAKECLSSGGEETKKRKAQQGGGKKSKVAREEVVDCSAVVVESQFDETPRRRVRRVTQSLIRDRRGNTYLVLFVRCEMDSICLIIDFDGFHICGQFYCREMGYVDATRADSVPDSIRFNLCFLQPGDNDMKTVSYCKRNIHGMTLRPMYKEPVCSYFAFKTILRELYEKHRTPNRYVVGFKGGSYERKVLDSMKIPSYNLEESGCPKYEELPDESEDCGYHEQIKKSKKAHCPRAEVNAFKKWMFIQP